MPPLSLPPREERPRKPGLSPLAVTGAVILVALGVGAVVVGARTSGPGRPAEIAATGGPSLQIQVETPTPQPQPPSAPMDVGVLDEFAGTAAGAAPAPGVASEPPADQPRLAQSSSEPAPAADPPVAIATAPPR